MLYGVCVLSAVPMRREPSDTSEMINQVIFGETMEILEKHKKWSLVRLAHDRYEGWVDNKQYELCAEEFFNNTGKGPIYTTQDLIEIISEEKTSEFFPIFLGSFLPGYSNSQTTLGGRIFTFKGLAGNQTGNRQTLVEHAYQYLGAPYLWGGRTPFGIDCSGFVQMVYRLAGYTLPRDSHEQAQHGFTLSFIEESEPGDLAFFDNEEGQIIHVGIILNDNYILHASGKVRLDRLDQTGIFNRQTGSHTHKLRVIKKIL